MASPAVILPPGELIYNRMVLSGDSELQNSIWAITRFAMVSLIGNPMKIILSLKRREKMS